MLLHDEVTFVVPVSFNNASLLAAAHCYVLLSTAVVQLRNGNLTCNCRVLLDIGSQSHFMSDKMAYKLNLPRKRVDITVSGVHKDNKAVRDSVKVQLESLRIRFFEEINWLVLSTLQQAIPSQYVDRS